jgi:hypothetical protein
MKTNRGTHQCPARPCGVVISNRLFACPAHWAVLSGPVKAAIYATAGMSLFNPARVEAIQAAREEWKA